MRASLISHNPSLFSLQVPQLSGKLLKLARFIIPSANPDIPFASTLALVCYNSEKVLWEQAIVIPIGGDGNIFLSLQLSEISSSAPKLEVVTEGFTNEENLTGIKAVGAALASGNMETLLPLLAPDFTLTVEGQPSPIAREDVPAFYETSRKTVVCSPLNGLCTNIWILCLRNDCLEQI